MKLLIENIKTASDKNLFVELANRLGFKAILITSEIEDKALLNAMRKVKNRKNYSKKKAEEIL